MKLSEISISRPILASMMSLGLIVFGFVGLNRLPVRELPDIDPPIINVQTVYTGASASVVETQITEPIEEALMSVEGIRTISSESRSQVSSITVEFNLTRDIDVVAQDVRDRVSRVRGRLPEDIEEPIVAKQDADASPVLWVALFSDRYSTLELSQLAENVFKDRLQTINGVSSVILGGEKRFAIRLWIDPSLMSAQGVTVLDVQTALQKENIELPSGQIESFERALSIETRGQMKTVEEYNNLVVKRDGDTLIRLKDIGKALVGVEDERSIARFNSKPAVGIGIIKQSKANTIEVVKEVKKRVTDLGPTLPVGVITSFPYDESIYVQKSIEEVWETLAIAFTLVVLTIFLFLHNGRSTLIPAVAIPVSIISTFGVLYLFGYSINIVTMLGLVLAIGLVVDDAIIVLENIYRHIEEGMEPYQAAMKGMQEIGFAVIATTVALVCVFIPMAFQTSVTGRLFIEFAVAIAMSVVISAFVALTLTPMMCARVLKADPPGHQLKGVLGMFERGLDWITRSYKSSLNWILNHGLLVGLIVVVSFGLTAFFYTRLDREFVPLEDKGRFLVFALAPEGSTSEYTDRMVKKMEGIVAATPETQEYFSAVALARGAPGNPAQGLAFIRLKEERKRHLRDIVGGPMGLGGQFFQQIQGAFAIPIMPKSFGGGFTQPFELVIQHQDLNTLNAYAQQLTNKLRGAGYLMNVRSNFEINKPELRISIDRDRAGELGVSVQDIAKTLQIAFGGLDISKVNINGKEYDVIAQMAREDRLTPQSLNNLYVRNSRGEQIQLSNLVTYDTGAGPSAINHFNRFRSAVIEGTPTGVTLGTAMDRTIAILKTDLPDGFRYEWKGETNELLSSSAGIYFILILALVIVYMVLAAQFESLIHPLTVMTTIPLASFGAFGLLWILSLMKVPSMGVNLYSQIGLILLIGLVVKNGILLVDFANQSMREGLTAHQAMLAAGAKRFRPILMTATATIMGILPIAIGFGASGEARRPLGVAAVGGMMTSTFLTLYVIPVVYVALSNWTRRKPKVKAAPLKAIVLLLCVTSLMGCNVNKPFIKPDLKFADQYENSANLSKAIVIERRWWETFQDPKLNALETTALDYNQDWKAALAKVDQARALARLSKSDLYPSLSIDPSFERERTSTNVNQFGGPKVSNTYTVPFDLSYEIDLWGKFKNAVKARQASAFAEEAAANLVAVRLTSDIALQYYLIRQLDLSIKVLEETILLRERVMEMLNSRESSGLTSSLDVARAKTELSKAKALMEDYKRRRMQAENALAVLCGKMPQDFSLSSTREEDLPPVAVIPAGLPSQLLSNRADIVQADYELQQAAFQIGVAKAEFLPTLTIGASAGLKSLDLDNLVERASRAWSIMPAMSMPIFDAGANKANLTATQAAYAEAVANYKGTVLRALQDVEDGLIEAQGKTKELAANEEYLAASKQAFDLSQSRYKEGLVSYLEVVDTHRQYLDAQLAVIQNRTQGIFAAINLIKALGGGWEK